MSERRSRINNERLKGFKGFRGLAAIAILSASGLLGAGVAHSIDQAEQEKPVDRNEAEHRLAASERMLQEVILGQTRGDSNNPKDVMKIIKEAGLKVEPVPKGQNVVNRSEQSILYIPGGIKFQGLTQALNQEEVGTALSGDGSKIPIDWSNVDNTIGGTNGRELPPTTFDALTVLNDKNGVPFIAGIPSVAAPNQNQFALNITKNATENGIQVTIGANSSKPLNLSIQDATEGHPIRLPFTSDQWVVNTSNTEQHLKEFADALYDMGIPITGVIDVGPSRLATIPDVGQVPVVDRWMVINNPSNPDSQLAIPL